MKKILALGLICSLFFPALAEASSKECRYYPLQKKIQTARSGQDIEELINKKYNFNMNFPCGGSVLQLAIIRGNPEVLRTLLEKGNMETCEKVPNTAFPIKGAPKELPISFFAAYHAPQPDIFTVFTEYCGSSIYQKDDNGQNILWYLEQNPVLNNTDTYDQVAENLMLIDSQRETEKENAEKNKQVENQTKNLEIPQRNNKKAQTNQKQKAGSLVEEEGSEFVPMEEDESSLTSSLGQ